MHLEIELHIWSALGFNLGITFRYLMPFVVPEISARIRQISENWLEI